SLRHLANHRNLQLLLLSDTPISDRGVSLLRGLDSLSILDLNGCAISDAGLEPLAQMGRLTFLELKRTSVTASGIAELNERHPTGGSKGAVLRESAGFWNQPNTLQIIWDNVDS